MNPGLSMENKAESNTILFKPKGPISIIFFVLGVCCILLATSGIIISNREGDYDWMNLVWIAMVCMGVYLVVLAFVCRKDFIQVDSNGLHYRGHESTPWPRTIEWYYAWYDLESFLLYVEEYRGEYSTIDYPFTISLYDKYGDEIVAGSPVGYFDLEEIQAFREVLSQHLMSKTLFDWGRYGEISFKMKSMKSMRYFALCLLVAGFCVEMPASIVIWLFSILFGFHCHIKENDFVTISSRCVKVDLHCGIFYRHVKKEVAYKDISFVKTIPLDRGNNYELQLFDAGGKELLSCKCVGLVGMDNLDVVLKEIFRIS